MAKNVIEFSIRGSAASAVAAMKKVSASIKSMGGALVKAAKWAAGSATALVGFVTVIANGVDKLAKFSNRLGIAVDELSRMQFVANQAGLSNENFNLSVQRMTRRVAEAAEGMGEAQGALRELGIDADNFKRLGLEDQMAVLADEFGDVEGSSDKLRLAFKLFDSEGTAVLQMLNNGSAAMREAARDADFLGITIGKQAAANAEHFTNSMGRATGAIKGTSRGIADELMPILSGLANRFANALASSRGSIVNFVKSAVQGFFTFIEVVKQVFARIKDIFSGNKEALVSLLTGIGNFVKSAGALFISLGKVIAISVWEGIKATAMIITDFGVWMKNWFTSTMEGKETQGFADAIATSLTERLGQAKTVISNEINESLGIMKSASEDAGSAMAESLGINMEEASAKARAAIVSISEFGTVAAEQVTTAGENIKTVADAMEERYTQFVTSMKNSSVEFADSFFNMMQTTIDSISSSIAQSIMEGKSLSDAFKGIVKQVLTSLITMLVKMGIQRLILAGIQKGAVTTEASSEAAKAVGMAAANGVASMAAAPFPLNLSAPSFGAAMGAAASAQFSAGASVGAGLGATVGARALGGPVAGGSTYLVGERGPELFTPNNSGTITTNEDLTGGGNVTIENISISILENATSAEALLNMDRTQMEEVVAGPIINALDSLNKKGVRPDFIERDKI